jgi:hypothetical protein
MECAAIESDELGAGLYIANFEYWDSPPLKDFRWAKPATFAISLGRERKND